jgi:hypothetical protein
MPAWMGYALLALIMAAAVLLVASGKGVLALIALAVVALAWIVTMRRSAK